jgi:hypothetical protein
MPIWPHPDYDEQGFRVEDGPLVRGCYGAFCREQAVIWRGPCGERWCAEHAAELEAEGGG